MSRGEYINCDVYDNSAYENSGRQKKDEREIRDLLAEIKSELDGGRIFNGHRQKVRDLQAKRLSGELTAVDLQSLEQSESKIKILEACQRVLEGRSVIEHLIQAIKMENDAGALYAANTSIIRGGLFKAFSTTYDIAEKVLARFGYSHQQVLALDVPQSEEVDSSAPLL